MNTINKIPERIVLKEERDKGIWEEWFDRARKCRLDDGSLLKFLTELANGYEHDYGTIVHAMTAAAIAGAYAIEHSPQGGITGFQHGCFVMDFLSNEEFKNSKLGFYIRDLDNLLYPQYEENFSGVTISHEQADRLKEMARKELSGDLRIVAPQVVAWRQRMAAGDFPVWLRIKD